MQTVSQSQRTFPEQARIPSPSRAVPKAHQIFRHARPRQFTASGRKRRITQERDRRTAQALSHFDQGSGVWASLKTILRELLAIEARREPDDQMTWSQATLCRSLVRLESSGVLKPHGIHRIGSKRWGTRQRSLHPEKLLPRSECENQISANVRIRSLESEKLEVKDFKTSDSGATSHHPQNQQTKKRDDDCGPPSKESSKSKLETKDKIPVEEGTEAKKIQPTLRAWVDSRILARAGNRVRSRSAYLRASRPEFIANMAEEVEMYLVEQAQEFMRHRVDEVSSVNFDEVCDLLRDRVVERGLPVAVGEYWQDLFSRVYDAAADILGLSDMEEGEAPAAPAPEPPAPPLVCCPKAIEKARRCEEAKLKRDRRREEAEIERNRKLAREKQIQAEELDRRREEERRSMMLAESLKQDEAYRNKVYRASAEGIAINKREQREQLARAHPDWSLAVALPASN